MTSKITVFGAGYVGLVTSVCLAEMGFHITCIDTDADKVKRLMSGDPVIHEEGLASSLHEALAANRIHFTTPDHLSSHFEPYPLIFIAVGTPSQPDGSVNLEYVESAIKMALAATEGVITLVIKSSIPPGVTASLHHTLSNQYPGRVIHLLTNPEFLREGKALEDCRAPDRIIIGTSEASLAEPLLSIYHSYQKQGCPICVMDWTSAEMVKYASNTFLAMKIAFINEMADLCERQGGNIAEVRKGMGLDSRIGERYLMPGPGFGGSCFPKDMRALEHVGRQVNASMILTQAALTSNNTRQHQLVKRIIALCKQDQSKPIGIWGLTFKEGTDDIRESPALAIILPLLEAGFHLSIYDPTFSERRLSELFSLHSSYTYAATPLDATVNAQCVILLTEWKIFAELSPTSMIPHMHTPLLVDLRGILPHDQWKKAGATVLTVGKKWDILP